MDAPAIDAKRDRRILLVEIGVVLTLTWLHSFVLAVEDFAGVRTAANRATTLTSIGNWNVFLSDFTITVAVLFIIWGSGDSFKRFGLRVGKIWSALTIFPFYLLHHAITWLSYVAWDFRLRDTPTYLSLVLYQGRHFAIDSNAHLISLICRVLMSAFYQELVYRGYLITRLSDLLGRRWLAVIVATVLFGSVHLYQGIPSTATITIVGFLFSWQYLLTKSVYPGTILHAFWNFMLYFAYNGSFLP